MYEADSAKLEIVFENGPCYMEDVLTGKVPINDTYLQELLQYVTSVGDILILDEFDKRLPLQTILDFCDVLSQLRDYWNTIIISGYNRAITRIFTYFEYDNDGDVQKEEVKLNLLYLKDNKIQKIDDWREIHECFNTIRG